MSDGPCVLNALTFDVEEWFQTVLFNRDNHPSRGSLRNNVLEILDLLDTYKVQATFFISAVTAESYTFLVKQIHARGHEIASHGYHHRSVYTLPPRIFKDDVSRSLDVLSGITGAKVIGYRAPTWSIFRKMVWAVDVLEQLGLKYDSSIYPASKNIFVCKGLPISPYHLKGGLIEFPPPVFSWMGYNIPFAGGTFLRFFSEDFIKTKLLNINHKGMPALVYFHSWEFDHALPSGGIPSWKKIVQYGNLRTVKGKLIFLLENFRFTSVRDVLQGMRLI